jgi:hypothetical protein
MIANTEKEMTCESSDGDADTNFEENESGKWVIDTLGNVVTLNQSDPLFRANLGQQQPRH